MTENRRIILNVIATYGRSLFSLACGLYSSRWALLAMGHEDYGLWGLVGGLTAFVTFFNDLLAGAIGRFYAVAVGKAKDGTSASLEVCRQWFNIALSIHVSLPLFLLIVGYPVGCCVIRGFLSIPVGRVESCIWVWRFVCLSCFVNMVNAPFRAMYTAKQYIAELTIYSVVQTAANVIVLYYMVRNPGDWLSCYACWACIIASLPQLIICIRAWQVFPECKIVIEYLWDWSKLKELGAFVFYHFWGTLAQLVEDQGLAILVNKYLGAVSNATVSIGRSVSSHATTLSSALNGALWPAISNAAGAGEFDHMRTLALKASKIGTILVLIFILPLMVEIDTVMALWLKNPPRGVSGLCLCILVTQFFDRTTSGNWMLVFALGKIKRYQIEISICFLIGFILAWMALWLSWGLMGVGFSLIVLWGLIAGVRVRHGWDLARLSAGKWFGDIFMPLLVLSVLSIVIGVVCRMLVPQSFVRVILSTCLMMLFFLPLTWIMVFDRQERAFVRDRLMLIKMRFLGEP